MSEFDAASPEDKAYAIAVHRAELRKGAWEEQKLAEKANPPKAK